MMKYDPELAARHELLIRTAALAAAFAEANPRFNRDRFLAACRP